MEEQTIKCLGILKIYGLYINIQLRLVYKSCSTISRKKHHNNTCGKLNHNNTCGKLNKFMHWHNLEFYQNKPGYMGNKFQQNLGLPYNIVVDCYILDCFNILFNIL